MASLTKDKNGNFLVRFRYGGQGTGKIAEFTKSANTRDRSVAEATLGLVKDTLLRLRRGWLVMPERAEPGEFIMSGGKRLQKPEVVATQVEQAPTKLTLGELFDLYGRDLPSGAKELTTVQTERTHRTHLLRLLGSDMEAETLTLAAVQGYANRRSREKWAGKTILRPTIIKELATLRVIWNWGRKQGHIRNEVPFQIKDLHFARVQEKPPFQTFETIRKTIERGGLTNDEETALWESLYLTREEVYQVLEYVRANAKHPFIYPMIAFAALIGARRSEICRSRIEDWDLVERTVNIREKKRKPGRSSFRMVDVCSNLVKVMGDWLANHPGGQHTICKDGKPLTVKMASSHFKWVLKGHAKWRHIPGFHTFRHSFASILASRGVDETTIDRWMGHQTQEQRESYRHLFPKNRKRAIELLSLSDVTAFSPSQA